MDLRQIECFLALYDEGSVTRAARRLNLVQPALSMRLARLEETLGEALFHRSSRGLRPTEAAQRLHALYAPILQTLAEANRQVARPAAALRGRITLGLIASVAGSALARSLLGFAARQPDVQVTAFEGYSNLLLDWVRAGLIDGAIVNASPAGVDLTAETLLEEPFALIGAATEPLPPLPALPALTGLRLVLPTQRHGLRTLIDRALAEARLTPRVTLELDTLSAIGQLVAVPGWFTLLPPTALQPGLLEGSLRARALPTPRLRRRVICATRPRQPLGAAGRLFLDLLREELAAQAAALPVEPAAAKA